MRTRLANRCFVSTLHTLLDSLFAYRSCERHCLATHDCAGQAIVRDTTTMSTARQILRPLLVETAARRERLPYAFQFGSLRCG